MPESLKKIEKNTLSEQKLETNFQAWRVFDITIHKEIGVR